MNHILNFQWVPLENLDEAISLLLSTQGWSIIKQKENQNKQKIPQTPKQNKKMPHQTKPPKQTNHKNPQQNPQQTKISTK